MKKQIFLALLMSVSTAANVYADTLKTALAKAYDYNPALKSARAGAQAVDENVALAKSGFRPTLTVEGGYSDSQINTNAPIKPVDGYNRSLTATINQPVFSGFKTIKTVSSAKSYRKVANDVSYTHQTLPTNSRV